MAEDDRTWLALADLLGEITERRAVLFTEPAVEMLHNPIAEWVRQGGDLDTQQIAESLTILMSAFQGSDDFDALDYPGRVLAGPRLGTTRRYINANEAVAFPPPRGGRFRLIDAADIVQGFALAYCRIPPFCGRPRAQRASAPKFR
jgi:hypothetical protein